MSRIKEDSAAKGPKAVIECLSEEVGGMLGAVASEQLPRNEKQVTNIKQRSNLIRDGTDKAADELFIVMQRAYSEDPMKKFIRDSTRASSGAC